MELMDKIILQSKIRDKVKKVMGEDIEAISKKIGGISGIPSFIIGGIVVGTITYFIYSGNLILKEKDRS